MDLKIKPKALLLISMMIIIAYSCKKEIPNAIIETNSFMHTYPMPADQEGSYIKATDDGGFLIIGSSGTTDISTNNSLIIKVDHSGKIVWSKSEQDYMRKPLVTELKDGNMLICGNDYGALWKLSKNGDPIFKNTSFTPAEYSYPIDDNNGNYIETYSRGSWGSSNNNFIRHFGYDGTIKKTLTLNDAFIGPKLFKFNCYKFDTSGTYYISGNMFVNSQWTWADINSFYVAKVTYQNNIFVNSQVQVLNTTNDNWSPYNLFINNPDQTTLITSDQYDFKANAKKGHLYNLDTALNVIWEKDVIINNGNTFIKSLFASKDGNYLVSGYYAVGKTNQAFVRKISKVGETIWTKTYNNTYSCIINGGQELPDGSMVFVGNTSSFGNGNNQSDIFMIKTDQDGNLK